MVLWCCRLCCCGLWCARFHFLHFYVRVPRTGYTLTQRKGSTASAIYFNLVFRIFTLGTRVSKVQRVYSTIIYNIQKKERVFWYFIVRYINKSFYKF